MEVLNIVDKLARNRVVEDMIKNMNINDYPDDLAQEIYLILLEYDKEKIFDIYNKFFIKVKGFISVFSGRSFVN